MRQLLWAVLAGWWLPTPAAPCKEGWGRGCFSYKEKKPQTIFFFSLILLRSYHAVLQK